MEAVLEMLLQAAVLLLFCAAVNLLLLEGRGVQAQIQGTRAVITGDTVLIEGGERNGGV